MTEQSETPKAPVAYENEVTIIARAEDGEIKHSTVCRRNIPTILRTVHELPKELAELKLAVVLKPKAGQEGAQDKAIAEGAYEDVIGKLLALAVHPAHATRQFQELCDFMTTRSTLKAAMINLVFEGAQEAGFVMIADETSVTDDELIRLDTVTRDQVDKYREAMKKKKPSLAFPSDNGGLILPSRFSK